MNQAKISGGAAHRSEALFFKSGICAFSRRSRRRISPLPESDKRPKPDGKPGTGLRFTAGRPRPRRRDARAARFTQTLHDACPAREAAAAPLRGIFEAVCPLPRPEPRPRLGASAGQGAPAEALSRRMSCHVHTYIRSRAGCFVARPRAYALTARCITHMLFRCSIARIRVHSGGRDRLAAEAVDALLRSRAYILY